MATKKSKRVNTLKFPSMRGARRETIFFGNAHERYEGLIKLVIQESKNGEIYTLGPNETDEFNDLRDAETWKDRELRVSLIGRHKAGVADSVEGFMSILSQISGR